MYLGGEKLAVGDFPDLSDYVTESELTTALEGLAPPDLSPYLTTIAANAYFAKLSNANTFSQTQTVPDLKD